MNESGFTLVAQLRGNMWKFNEAKQKQAEKNFKMTNLRIKVNFITTPTPVQLKSYL